MVSATADGYKPASLRFAVEWQRLDNPLVPTRGLKLQGAVELATPARSRRVIG